MKAAWVAVAVLATVAAVLGVVLATRGPSPQDDRAAVLERSTTFVLALTQFAHDDLDREEQEVLSLATGAFAEDYRTTFRSDEMRQAVVSQRASATATIEVGPLLSELDAGEARTLTVVRQEVSAPHGDPVERRLRVELRWLRVDGTWLVEQVTVT